MSSIHFAPFHAKNVTRLNEAQINLMDAFKVSAFSCVLALMSKMYSGETKSLYILAIVVL